MAPVWTLSSMVSTILDFLFYSNIYAGVTFRAKPHAVFTVYSNCGLFSGLVLLAWSIGAADPLGTYLCPQRQGPSPGVGVLFLLCFFFCILLHFSVVSSFPASSLPVPGDLHCFVFTRYLFSRCLDSRSWGRCILWPVSTISNPDPWRCWVQECGQDNAGSHSLENPGAS